MYVLIVWVVGIYAELGGRCAEVSLGKEIHRGVVIYEDPHSDVKLSLIHQERFLDVFLEYERIMLDLVLWQLLLLLLGRLCLQTAASDCRLSLLILSRERGQHSRRLWLFLLISGDIIVVAVFVGGVFKRGKFLRDNRHLLFFECV